MSYSKEIRLIVLMVSYVQLFVIPWTVACQAALSMEFSRQDYWSRLSFPSPWDLSNPVIKSGSALQADSLPFEPPGKHIPTLYIKYNCNNSNNVNLN